MAIQILDSVKVSNAFFRLPTCFYENDSPTPPPPPPSGRSLMITSGRTKSKSMYKGKTCLKILPITF